MKIRYLLSLLIVAFYTLDTSAQSLEKDWQTNTTNDTLTTIFSSPETLSFQEGAFTYKLNSGKVHSSGEYVLKDKQLVFFYQQPKDSIARFEISALTDSTLTLQNAQQTIRYNEQNTSNASAEGIAGGKKFVKSQGFTFTSFWRGAIGMISLLLIAFLLSNNRKAINWRTVGLGLGGQLLLAYGILQVEWVQIGFEFVGQIFVKILDFTAAGSEFLLGDLMNVDSYGFIFLFQVLPTVIFFSALTSILFYLGVIQIVVKGLALLLSRVLGVSGAEGLSVAGNIFLGQTEAPLMIKAYLEKMTKSEILLVMVGGMATVAGGVLAAYIGFLGGDDPVARLEFAKHLLAASVMAAPGAIIISKLLYPQQEEVDRSVEVSQEKIGDNILDAIANGTTEGLKLAANVGAMLLVFVALIAMLNYGFGKIGAWTNLNSVLAENTPYQSFSIESTLGIIFSPLMWLIGIAKEDIMLMGQLLGIKLAASEFVGYIQLAELKDATAGLSLTYEKSIIMATYMLCGFANFASIGIQIGGIGSLAPGQRKTLSRFGIKSVIGGTLASLLSATIAGMIIG